MGCLFAMFGGLFPRLALLVVWIARPALVGTAFNTFLLPLLGIIFLPFATLIYVSWGREADPDQLMVSKWPLLEANI